MEIISNKTLYNAMVPRSSADNWKPPIHVSNWLIFCCVNFMLHQKKEMKMIKNKKNAKKVYKRVK